MIDYSLVLNVLGATSILISLVTIVLMGKNIYGDYVSRKAARARYEKDPNLHEDILSEDFNFYTPSVTVGDLFTGLVLWVMPGINLVTMAYLILAIIFDNLKRVWNNPVIDW